MTQALNNEEINEIVENFSGEERVDFLSKDKENWNNFKQNSPLFVENSPSVDVLYSNPLYTPAAVHNQKTLNEQDRAFKAVRPDNLLDRLIEAWKSASLSEERNSLYLKAREATGAGKILLEKKIQEIDTDLQYLYKPETLSDKTTSAVSSIARSALKTAPYAVAGGALTSVTGGGALPLIGASLLRASGGVIESYKPTYENALVEIYQQNPDMPKEEAEEMAHQVALPSSLIEGVGDVFGASSIAVSSFSEKGLKVLLKKNIEKLTKEGLKKKAAKYAGKMALGALAEGAQEVAQSGIEKRTLEKTTATEKVFGSIDDAFSVLSKVATGQELNENEKDLVETFVATTLASLIFSGSIDASSNGFNILQDAREQKKFEKSSEAYFKARSETNLTPQLQKAVTSVQDIPSSYSRAEQIKLAIDEELETNASLTEQQRAELTALSEKCSEAISTTGILELEGQDYANYFLSPEFASLKQKTQGMFFAKPTMVDGGFSAEQIALQAVGEISKEALESDSAFFDAYNAIKGITWLNDEDAKTNALQFNALANIVSSQTGKTWAEIKEERGISFDISKGLFGKEKVEGFSVKEQEMAVDELQTNLESIAEALSEPSSQEQLSLEGIIVDEETKQVVDGNKRVRAAKKAGVKKVKVKTVKKKDAEKLKQKKAEQYSLLQGEAGSLDYSAKQIILRLTDEANPTTFAHESFHLFQVLMGDLYLKDGLNSYWKKQFEKMYKSVGVKDLGEMLSKGIKSESFVSTQEKLAESWERYLMDGIAPKQELEGLFARFKSLFASLYETLVRTRKINKDVRQVFDSIFLTQKEAEVALRAVNIGAMKKPDYVSDETYAKYVAAKQKSASIASGKIIKAVKKASEEIKNSEEYKNAEREIESQIRNELSAQEVFVVQKATQSETLPSGAVNPKINVSEMRTTLKGLAHIKGITNNKNEGLSVNDYVSFLNSELGTAMDVNQFVQYITGNDLDTAVQERLSEKMSEWLQTTYPDLYEQMKAYNNIQNASSVDAVIYEYIFAKKLPEESFGEVKVLMEKAKEKVLSQTKTREVANRSKYQKMLTGNVLRQKNVSETSADFANLKYNQAIIMMVLSESKKAEALTTKFKNHFEKFGKTQDKADVKKIDAHSFDLIRSIVKKVGLKVGDVREDIPAELKLKNWLDNSRNYSDVEEVFNPLFDFISGDGIKSYLDMNYRDFETFNELLRDLEAFARHKTIAEVEGKVFDFKSDASAWVQRLKEIGYSNKDSLLREMEQWLLNVPRFLQGIMPEEINLKYIKDLSNGYFKANVWMSERADIFSNILAEERNRLGEAIVFNHNGNSIVLTREQALVLMLHSGTEHNAKCVMETMKALPDVFGLIDGEDLDAQVESVYRTILEQSPKEFQEITNKIWAEIDSHKQELKDAYFEAEGLIMKLEKIKHFDFKGSVLDVNLGYFPATRRNLYKQDETYNQHFRDFNGFSAPSMTKDRTDTAHNQLDLSLDALNGWVRSVGNYMFIAPSWNRLDSLMGQTEIRNALGEKTTSFIENWMRSFRKKEQVFFIIKALDNVANIRILGADVIKATRQLSGLFFSTIDVGVKEMVYSLSKYLSNPSAFLNPMQSASKLSDYMKQRYSNPSKYLYAGYNDKIAFERYGKTLGVTKNVFEKYHNYSLIMLTYADAICSQITWEASYAKALSEGKSKDEASYVADRTVMLTQGDGSVFNRPKAMSGAMRFLTKYASFFYSLHSSVATDIICFKDPKAKLHLAATLTYVIILGSMYECLISSIGKDEDEEEDKKLLKAMASTAFSAATPVLGIGGKFAQAFLEERTYQTNIPFLTELDNVAKLINELKREDKSVEEVLPDIFKTLIPIPRATQKLFGEE